MLRSAGAVLAGFATTAVLILLTTTLFAALYIPGGGPGAPTYLASTLLAGALASALGGAVAARLAPTAPLPHAAAVAVVILALSVPRLVEGAHPAQPVWIPALIAVLGPLAALGGGWLASRSRRAS